MTRSLIVLLLVVVVGCGGKHRPARDKYNEGVALLANGDFEGAIKALMDARSEAGVDPELRFRAAYDLGIAYIRQSDKLRTQQDDDPVKALELATRAASWLADAQRQRPDHADTQTNLAIVRAKVQSLTDEVRKGEGRLEARLEAALGQQRGVLEDARAAWVLVKRSGGADRTAQHDRLTALADRERGIVAEVGAIADLAADEIDAIGQKPEDKRDDKEKVRVVQLKNLELYLLEARNRIAETRRALQELATEKGITRAEAALVQLKRAREQLLDPITVLKTLAQEEQALVRDTQLGTTKQPLVGDPADGEPPPALPSWLAPAALAERQNGVRDRLEEVRARLAAGTEQAQPAPEDPEQAKLLARVRTALPHVGEASAAMDRAHQSLGEARHATALEHERAALIALSRAIEEFADLKQLIELAYAEQAQIAMLLTPEAAKQLSGDARAKATRDGLDRNVSRVAKLQPMLVEETERLLAELDKAPAAPPAPNAGSGAPADDRAAQRDAITQRSAKAEELRAAAAAALAELDRALGKRGDPTKPAGEAKQKLEELRKLFFDLIEHLQQLIRDQGDSRDQTSAISADPLSRESLLPPLVTRQEEHAATAKAIVDALAAQADAAGKAPAQPAQPGAPDGKTYAAAAQEVRLADDQMLEARGTLVKARDAKASSEDLTPAITAQAKAVEHLENALRLLQPPQQQDQKQDPQQQEQQQEQQPQQPQQQGGAGQRAAEQDAKRQRDKQQREAAPGPVEKDW